MTENADITKNDTFVAALTHALLESDYGATGPPKEVHLVVDAPEEIITCRKCIERVIAKRSDPVAADRISSVRFFRRFLFDFHGMPITPKRL